MLKTFFVILCVTFFVQNVTCWRFFWKGRINGGNLKWIADNQKTENLLGRSGDEPVIEDKWFIQFLDHFDPTNQNVWKQRYFVNDEFYTGNGPVFLMIGGEGEASKKFMTDGTWIHFAKEHKALCFQLEHRYYGKSRPTSDMSTENLMYLSSEQALSDLAYFVTAMNGQYNITSDQKWIAFGGSYPGSLAAWVRKKYPHLIHGSVSSSGPLLAKADFPEYFDVVTASLRTHSQRCVDVVQKSFSQIEILMRHMIGQRNLDKVFNLCDPLEESVDNPFDVANFFEALADNFAGVVQYNKDNRKGSEITIDTICDILVNETIGTPITRLAAMNDMLLNKTGQKCLDYKYEKMLNEMTNESWSSSAGVGGRQWTYQTCTEFGFYQTAEDKDRAFGDHFGLDFFIKQCRDIYGDKFDDQLLNKSIVRTNIYYGALNPDTTNVIYVHGSIDPWHALGLTKSLNPNTPTIFIQGTAHCADMYEPSAKDTAELNAARLKINEFIKNLLV